MNKRSLWNFKPKPWHKQRQALEQNGKPIAWADGNQLRIIGEIPDTMLLGVIGRKLVDVIDRNDFGRAVTILAAERCEIRIYDEPVEHKGVLAGDYTTRDGRYVAGWELTLSGPALLPRSVMRARKQPARRSIETRSGEGESRPPKG